MLRADLCRTLPVNLQNDVDTQRELLVYPGFGGAVKIAIDLGALKKLIRFTHRGKGRFVDKMIVNAVDLTFARRSRCMRHRDAQRLGAVDKRLNEASLAGT